jgi:DNA-directed RNA polymerase
MQTFTGREYLMIDIANSFGLDKLNWDDRLGWFEQNEDKLDSLIKLADEPALFFAGVQAWKKVKKGEPSGYPISLDATSSGIQILAALTGDRKAAQLCNVVNTGNREDAYKKIYEIMVNKIGDEAKIDRKETKKAIMTLE